MATTAAPKSLRDALTESLGKGVDMGDLAVVMGLEVVDFRPVEDGRVTVEEVMVAMGVVEEFSVEGVFGWMKTKRKRGWRYG